MTITGFLVGMRWFEHPTSWSRTKRTTKLCYIPNLLYSAVIIIAYLHVPVNSFFGGKHFSSCIFEKSGDKNRLCRRFFRAALFTSSMAHDIIILYYILWHSACRAPSCKEEEFALQIHWQLWNVRTAGIRKAKSLIPGRSATTTASVGGGNVSDAAGASQRMRWSIRYKSLSSKRTAPKNFLTAWSWKAA